MKSLNGPQSLSFIQLINWILRPLDFLEECAQKHGDIFNLNLMGLPRFTVVSNPQVIAEIFNVDGKDFDVERTNNIVVDLFGDNSFVLPDGAEHRQQSKLIMPPFQGEKVKSYATTICQLTE